MAEHPMTNFVEATNCHHHYIWQATHASEGDAVYMQDDDMGSNEHKYHDESHHNEHDSDFRVESDGSGIDNEEEEHFLDNSQDDRDSFFESNPQSSGGGGGGGRYGGPMILPSSGRIER